MRKIETAEQARVWLHTYETCMTRSYTQQESIDAADRAVEAWCERVGTSDQPRAEDADLRTKRDAARALLEDVRKALKADKVPDTGVPGVAAIVLAANEALRREREEATAAHCRAVGERDVAQQRLEERCAELKAISDVLPPGEGAALERVKALAAERNSLQEDLAAMKERLAVAEGQLAGVRIILEAAGVPARGTLEERLRAALEFTLGSLPVEACTGSGKHAASGQGRELVCPECRQGPPTVECDGVWVREHGRQA